MIATKELAIYAIGERTNEPDCRDVARRAASRLPARHPVRQEPDASRPRPRRDREPLAPDATARANAAILATDLPLGTKLVPRGD